MLKNCITYLEPCHDGDCSGFDEVVDLLPRGRLWNPDRGGIYGAFVNALGHIKTELNKAICQEFLENDPCKSVRLFGYWADLYKLPKCVEQSQENLCAWIGLINGDCPIGSQGFIRRAIEFVAPGKGITVDFKLSDIGANCWCAADIWCFDNNPIVISSPVENFQYEEINAPYPHDAQDGENPCRRYYIPEIECIRDCVFPFGLGVGYNTNVEGIADSVGPIEYDRKVVNCCLYSEK